MSDQPFVLLDRLGPEGQTSFRDLRILVTVPSRPRVGSLACLARESATNPGADHGADGKHLVVVDAKVPLRVCWNGYICIRRRGRRKQARPEKDYDLEH